MRAPLYQRLVKFTSYTLLGVVAIGALCDAFSNAISVIKPITTYASTAIAILLWVAATITIRMYPVRWVIKGGKQVRIKKLGTGLNLTLMGIVIFLWIPRLLDPKQLYSHLQVTVEPRSDRSNWANANTEDSLTRNSLSDLVIVSRNGKVLINYSLYSVVNSDKQKNYLLTAPSFENALPTETQPSVIDLDQDGNDEVILKIRNQEYGLHSDELVACLILNSNSDVVATAPLPSAISGFTVPQIGPYSAYNTFGTLVDKNSKRSWPVSYTNYIDIKRAGNGQTILFGWVLDDSCYLCTHVYQIDAYTYNQGQLEQINTKPLFWISNSEKQPIDLELDEFSSDVNFVAKFIEENNQPSFGEMFRYFVKRRAELNKSKRK
jgi:hypothetical protein